MNAKTINIKKNHFWVIISDAFIPEIARINENIIFGVVIPHYLTLSLEKISMSTNKTLAAIKPPKTPAAKIKITGEKMF